MARLEVSTPLCKSCTAKLKPNFEIKRRKKIRIIGYGYKSNGFFCSVICGFNYAIEELKNNTAFFLSRSDAVVKANRDRGYHPDGSLKIVDEAKL